MSYGVDTFQPLQGPRLTLLKAVPGDLEEMAQALISPTTWFSRTWGLNDLASLRAGLTPTFEQQAQGQCLFLKALHQDKIVAISNFHSAPKNFTRVEIGFTWIADAWQRTFVNTELKLLMLSHAFDTMKVRRVEFSVHPANEKSRLAMLRIGAKYEGTLRQWRFNPNNPTDDGDRCIYAILDYEWPMVEKALKSHI